MQRDRLRTAKMPTTVTTLGITIAPTITTALGVRDSSLTIWKGAKRLVAAAVVICDNYVPLADCCAYMCIPDRAYRQRPVLWPGKECSMLRIVGGYKHVQQLVPFCSNGRMWVDWAAGHSNCLRELKIFTVVTSKFTPGRGFRLP